MDDKEYKLPTRKWYTLEQAAKRINKLTGEEIEIADLFHYWGVGILEISTKFKIGNGYLNIGGIDFNKEDIEDCIFSDGEIWKYNLDPILKISESNYQQDQAVKMGMPLPEFWDIIALEHGALKTLDPFSGKEIIFSINGLMSIVADESFLDEDEILSNGIKLDEFPLFSSPLELDEEKRLFFTIVFNENFYQNKQGIQIDNLFILDKNLDDFLKKNAKPPKKEKAPTTKTLNSQAEFIRNLITIHYGEKVANNIRNELENPRSRITCDFEKNGLKPAAGKAVHRWINQI